VPEPRIRIVKPERGEPSTVPSACAIERGERWARLAARIAKAFGVVLLLVIATFVLASLTKYAGWSAVGISALGAASAAVGLASSGLRAELVWAAGSLALGCVTFAVVAALSGRNGFLAIAAFIQIALLAWAAGAVLRTVIGESEVGFRTILGAISVYLIFGLLFTALYVAIDRLQAGLFFGSAGQLHTGDFVFFSFTTLTTTGYGNLIPAGQPGKMFAVFEMLLGQIFLVTLIARLVSLWRPARRANRSA
jgi:hypothetical protein